MEATDMPDEKGVGLKNHQCQEVFMHGFRFKTELDAYWDYLSSDRWEPETKAFYKKYTYPDKNILDIGAWIGPTVFIGYANNARHIYAVEADPHNFHSLKLNCCHNYMQDRVTLINRCIYGKSGQTLRFGQSFEGGDSSSKSFADENGARVLSATVCDLIRDYQIDPAELSIIKIDIEGSEIFVVSDLEYLSRYKGLRVNLSMHPKFWPEKTADLASFAPLFKGYDVFDSRELPLNLDEHTRLGLSKDVYEIILKPK